MKFYTRAFYYVTRKKSKTVLLLLIMTIAVSMLLSGLSILHNVQSQRQDIGEKSQTKLSISSGEAEGAITPKEVEQISALDNVAWVNRVSSVLVSPVDFELAPGTETPQKLEAKIYGYDDTEADGSFSAQLLRLQSGRHLDPESSYAVLLHHSLADANALSLGDTIAFKGLDGQAVTATIQGMYQLLSDAGSGNQRVPTAQRAENQIYATQDLIGALQRELKYEQLIAYLKTPEELQSTQQTLENLLGRHEVSAHDATFKRMQDTLMQVEKSAILLLVLTAVTAILALTLLLCMWTRERMREFALLLSLGNPVGKIYLQVVTELFLLFAGAVALALPAASCFLPLLSHMLLTGEFETGLEVQFSATEMFPVFLTGLLVLTAVALIALLPLASTNIKALLSHTD